MRFWKGKQRDGYRTAIALVVLALALPTLSLRLAPAPASAPAPESASASALADASGVAKSEALLPAPALGDASGVAKSGKDRRCPREPYPCGNEWPKELADRDDFELDRVEDVEVTAEDGTVLHGWVAFPDVPDGVKMPTVLSSSPYYDSMVVPTSYYRNPSTEVHAEFGGLSSWWSELVPMPLDVNTHSAGFPPIRLIRKGYALAYFSVRGTGSSEGCFDGGGDLDQSDQGDIIDWIEAQDWSNGRVGMVGLSAPSRASWQAAVEAPKALKTIVTAGDFLDVYQWIYTPQGSESLLLSTYMSDWSTQQALLGGTFAGETGIAGRAGCDPARILRQEASANVTGDRNADYYRERSLATRLGNIKAAILETAGALDLFGHYGQDSTVWGSLDPKTPRVVLRGQWGHDHPTPWNPWQTRLNFPSGEVEWEQYVTDWFDYWLKGIGPKPRTNVIYHQDQNLEWHEATDWSAEPNKKEVLYLSQDGLTTKPAAGDVTFLSAPNPLDAHWFEQAAKSLTSNAVGGPANEGFNPTLCPTPLDEGLGHKYLMEPAEEDVLIAGNPFAFVNASSDTPGGTITVSLYDVAPDYTCTGSKVTGASYIASGSADLNFYRTPYLSHDFPVDTPTEIRIDLSDTTYMLAEGHMLAVLVSNGGPYERAGSLFTPNITLHGVMEQAARASHIVIPVAEGTLGGAHPTVRYPQRPFTPRGYRD